VQNSNHELARRTDVRKCAFIMLLMTAAYGLALANFAAGSPDDLAGVKTKAEIEALVAKLRAGELKGAQPLFEKEDGPYRIYTSYIENRKGAADIHGLDNEIFLIMSGSAEVTLGGDVTDKKSTAENEFRGTTITGGTTRTVGAGDIISIPRGIAHQMNPGNGHVLYIVIKMSGGR
jgi:mannose-6-phosphate isomerase-like protein (cupin superfamily)